jgi:5'-nucleotidase
LANPVGRRGGGRPSVAKVAASATDLPLVVGVSTRVLFELEEEDAVFARQGEAAYADLQRQRETTTLEPGCAFALIRRLLALNPPEGPRLVEVVLLSRNPPDLALRAFLSCERHGLVISTGSFTSGRPLAPFLASWGVDLFLSKDDGDVRDAVASGVAAARLGRVPLTHRLNNAAGVHFALDGDAVVFGGESEAIYRERGLEAFERNERRRAQEPLTRGPFGGALLRKLVALRRLCRLPNGASRVRLTMVTARAVPAVARVVRTLRHWNAHFDEIHFVGGRSKAPFLAAVGADVFFDDAPAQVEAAARLVAAGCVPQT